MKIAKSNSRRWVPFTGFLIILTLTACGGSSAAPAASGQASATGSASTAADTIIIKNFMFSPASLSVAPGAVITVRNQDSVTHTLTDKADPKLFGTGDIGAGQVKTFKAPGQAGSYSYICMIHQYMTGTLVVR